MRKKIPIPKTTKRIRCLAQNAKMLALVARQNHLREAKLRIIALQCYLDSAVDAGLITAYDPCSKPDQPQLKPYPIFEDDGLYAAEELQAPY